MDTELGPASSALDPPRTVFLGLAEVGSFKRQAITFLPTPQFKGRRRVPRQKGLSTIWSTRTSGILKNGLILGRLHRFGTEGSEVRILRPTIQDRGLRSDFLEI